MPMDVQGSFVSQKINKIRWIPEDYVETKSFFTGSWDDDNNSVKVWTFEAQTESNDIEYPRQQSEYKTNGDVTEIKFVEKNKIAVSTSKGDVKILEVSDYDKETPLKEVFTWEKLHKYGNESCPCTSVNTLEGDIATVGEDGCINILNGRRGGITRSIPEADSCTLMSVCFVKHEEIITGNIRGHMKIWDLRSQSNNPTSAFLLAGDELAATCIINHPAQPHIVLAGSESGSIAVWDLRMDSFPTSVVTAHSDSITEMMFHPENPNRMYTSSVSGDVWEWNMENMTKSSRGPDNQVATFMPLESKSAMMANALISPLHKTVNSIDCDKGRILCGADNEAIYLIRNLKY